MIKLLIQYGIALGALTFFLACGGNSDNPASSSSKKTKAKSMVAQKIDPMKNLGVGPIKTAIVLESEINTEMADEGKSIYKAKCSACHKKDKKFIGPAPKGILERRHPTWIMNMILDPEKMVKEDPIAKELLMEFNGAPMANQSLTEDEARSILEYFRTL